MNMEILKGKWEQVKGSIQEKWGKLTDNEVDQIEGDANKLSGLIQEHYGKSKEQAEKEIDKWLKKV